MFDASPDQGPLYQQVKRTLLDAITRQEYQPGQPFITLREACQRFNCSTTTALKAIGELVNEGWLVRVRGKGTFVAERSARPAAPAGRDETTVACIVPYLESPHVNKILRGVEAVCAQRGYRMYLTHTDRSVERENQALRQAVSSGAGGVLLYPAERGATPAVLGELRHAGLPVVLVDRYRPDVATDTVVADNFAVGHALTEELIRHGHERIALLWSEPYCTSAQDRLSGHLRALTEHELPMIPQLTVLRPHTDPDDAARRAALAALLDSPQPPTALICSHGHMLATAAQDLLTLGVAIPEQVDLAATDDAGPVDLLLLASIAASLPSEEMGVRGMGLLADRIESADPWAEQRMIQLPIEVRTRDSGKAQARIVGTQAR